ncbi:MAG: Holliday junction resolvase RuvX [Pseudomonadota bacterium]
MINFDVNQFKDLLKNDYRLIGFDIGKVRIGCALSDPQKFLATGLTVFNLKKRKFSINYIKEIIEKEKIYGIVVGYPLQMDGNAGEACEMVDKFIKKYLLVLEQPIFLQDERLSTAAVGRYFKEMQLTRKQQSEINDKASATYILQTVLDKLQYI